MNSAGGEMITGADQAEAMCAAGLYDVLMPDIKYAGSYRGMQEIARVCERHGRDYSPHNPTGPIAHLASIHLCAAAPALLWLEHQWDESPLFDSLVGGVPAALVDGVFVVLLLRLGDARSQLAAAHPGSRYPRARPGAKVAKKNEAVEALFPGFRPQRIATSGAAIHCVIGGRGPPLLLLHGYPQTHAIWHRIAPRLAERYTVVCSDLRGYGDSSKPDGGAGHVAYSKCAMALDQLIMGNAGSLFWHNACKSRKLPSTSSGLRAGQPDRHRA
jgi:hypothetical protein